MQMYTPIYMRQGPPLCEACKRDRDTLAHHKILGGWYCWRTQLYYEQNEHGVLKFSVKLKPSRNIDDIVEQIRQEKKSPSSSLS